MSAFQPKADIKVLDQLLPNPHGIIEVVSKKSAEAGMLAEIARLSSKEPHVGWLIPAWQSSKTNHHHPS